MNATSENPAPFLTLAENSGFPGGDPAWLKALRAGGSDRYATLGLPHVRTSPDHGTAFDLAGQGKASMQSFANAVKLARRLIHGQDSR